jgi:hypothetical protein
MSLRTALLALALFASSSVPPPSFATPQGGYTRERFPELGVDLDRPRDYEAIPTQPDEQFVVLYYAEKLDPDPAKRRSARPELSVVDITFVPDPPPPEPDPVPPPAPEEDEEGSAPWSAGSSATPAGISAALSPASRARAGPRPSTR